MGVVALRRVECPLACQTFLYLLFVTFCVSLFLSFQIDTILACGGLVKNSLFIQEHADIIGLSFSPPLSLPLSPSVFLSLSLHTHISNGPCSFVFVFVCLLFFNFSLSLHFPFVEKFKRLIFSHFKSFCSCFNFYKYIAGVIRL